MCNAALIHARAGVVSDAPKSRPLPAFTPPSRYDLRALAQHYSDDESIQTLIQEIDHARAFVLRVEALRLVIERCWRAETDCDLAALIDAYSTTREREFHA